MKKKLVLLYNRFQLFHKAIKTQNGNDVLFVNEKREKDEMKEGGMGMIASEKVEEEEKKKKRRRIGRFTEIRNDKNWKKKRSIGI